MYFSAHFESAPYETPESLWRLMSEIQSKTLNLEQNVPTKCQKVECVCLYSSDVWLNLKFEKIDFRAFLDIFT